MNALLFFEKIHGNECQFLSKDACVSIMSAFAVAYSDNKFEEYKNKKDQFNSESWSANYEERRKKV